MPRTALSRRAEPALQLLLIEDNPSDAFVVGSLLDQFAGTPYDVQQAATQTQALQLLDEQGFDVCLLDLTLPDADGFSALIELQQKVPTMPVLILTGVNDMALAKQAVGRGAQDYLLKDELDGTALARSVDYAIERKRTEKTLFERANYDGLTGLANRVLFETRLHLALAKAARLNAAAALLYIDLDGFKPINDLYGHNAGDEALKVTAQRLKTALRAYDTSARLGGDEFAVLLENISSPRDAAVIARKLIQAIAMPIPYYGKRIELGASIGIAFVDRPIAAEALLRNADTAMYQAKKEAGNCYRFYAPETHGIAQAHLKLEEELKTALNYAEFCLYYQPYLAASGDKVVGVEALLRWENPRRGTLQPEEFLPIAEVGRMMPEIGGWVGTRLRRDIALWNQQALLPLEIALNLSASQLDAAGLIEWIAPVVKEDFLGNHQLVAEIPEDALASVDEGRRTTLLRLYEMGVNLHLDHVGRTSLPLQTLPTLPFSLLKLDRSMIQNMMDDRAGETITRAAISLAHDLGMKAGAVGVETVWQQQALAAQQCDVLQGFLTAQPMAAEQLAPWLAAKESSLSLDIGMRA
jgi:diguanylate cyclase (GGDEF)-like protein